MRDSLKKHDPHSDERSPLVDGLERRILHSAVPSPLFPTSAGSLELAPASAAEAAEAAETTRPPMSPLKGIQIAAGTFDSDPAGLTNDNTTPDQAMVIIVDGNNPNAIFDTESLERGDVSSETPLGNLDALKNWKFLKPGDSVFLRNGDYTINGSLQIAKDNITIASYPGENAIVRHGSFNYQWAIVVKGDNFRMNGIEYVGHKQTDEGTLYSSLGMLIQGDNATIENSVFRHNANFLPVDQGGDIAFGKRTSGGQLLNESQQRWGRMVAFEHNEGGVFRNNVVAVLEKSVAEQFKRKIIDTEGLMLQNAEVLVEHNQFGAAGHHALSIRSSTAVVRHNTFGDVSKYEATLGITLSEHVRVPSTHTSVAIYQNEGTEFSHNVVSYNHADPADTGYGLQLHASTQSEVFNNLFVDGGGTGFAIGMGISPTDPNEKALSQNRIYNNTFFNTSSPISLGYFATDNPTGLTKIHDNEIFNNVITVADRENESDRLSENSPVRLNVADENTADGTKIYNNLIVDYDSPHGR